VCQTPLLEEQAFGPRPDANEVPRMIRINGYLYMRDALGGDGPFAGLQPQPREELRRWRTQLQPQVDDVVNHLFAFDPASVRPGWWKATVDRQQADFWRVFGAIHRYAVGAAEATVKAFQAAYTERFGADRLEDARALLQGFPNASLERASMLWDLSRIARRDEALLAALEKGESLPETESARRFQAGLTALLEKYGSSTNANTQDVPTWREDPSIPLAQVLAYVKQPDDQSPQEASDRQARQREALESQLRSLAETDESVAAMLPLLEGAQEFLPNLEDHNYHTDQCLLAGSRARWLSMGRLLHSQARLVEVDDVFYLYLRELTRALEGGPLPHNKEIEDRRRFIADCRAVSPPPLLGKGAAVAQVSVIKGVGASKGTYRGRARVVDAVEDAGRLQPGEVLVCRATTPAWTPYFGVAGAVVTNTGGALSHTAIVAREFGIPAVLGTRTGNVQIPDGAMVVVDGTAGTVTIENEA
jgi:pyruvate,water dikinase